MLPQLETPRLILRELCLEDGPALQAFQSRQSYWSRQAMEPEDFKDGAERVKHYLRYRGTSNERWLYVYVGLLRGDSKIIGQASLSRWSPAIASIGFGIDGEHAGRGLATEIASRLLGFGFEELKVHRIQADVALENSACIRVLEKVGMVREGVARDCIFAQGRWWTEAKYAILEDEHRSRAVAA